MLMLTWFHTCTGSNIFQTDHVRTCVEGEQSYLELTYPGQRAPPIEAEYLESRHLLLINNWVDPLKTAATREPHSLESILRHHLDR